MTLPGGQKFRSPSNVSPMLIGAGTTQKSTSPKLLNLSSQLNAILTERKLKKAEKSKSRIDGDGSLLMNMTATNMQKD